MPIEEHMTLNERRKYLKLMKPPYEVASRKEKQRMLSDMQAVTGLHRKSLLRLLNESLLERPLQEHWRILYLDGTMILTALGVDLAGNKEVLVTLACAEEGKEGWLSVLHDLRARGATQMDLIVTDGHDGLVAAV